MDLSAQVCVKPRLEVRLRAPSRSRGASSAVVVRPTDRPTEGPRVSERASDRRAFPSNRFGHSLAALPFLPSFLRGLLGRLKGGFCAASLPLRQDTAASIAPRRRAAILSFVVVTLRLWGVGLPFDPSFATRSFLVGPGDEADGGGSGRLCKNKATCLLRWPAPLVLQCLYGGPRFR